MSDHSDEGRLLAWLDGELPEEERREVEAHVGECLPCRRRLEEVRARAATVASALGRLDRPVSTAEAWANVRAALGSGAPPVSGAPPARPSRDTRRAGSGLPGRWSLARAAGLVLLLAGGAAAAMVPGSPVRSWIFPDDPQVLETPAAEAVAGGAVRAAPTDGAMEVALSAPGGSEVRVELGATERAGISGPAGTRYATEDGRLEADAPGGPLRVELPAGIRRATLRVNGVVVLTIRDGAVESLPEGAEGTLEVGPDAPLVFRVR